MADSAILCGGALTTLRFLPDRLVQTCVTSPPYFGLRDYGGGTEEVGREKTLEAYVESLVEVFREVRRVLRDDGTLWLNIGDSYNAYNGNRGDSKSISAPINGAVPKLPSGAGLTVKTLANKQLLMVPAIVALALRSDGWFLRSDIIWHKPNPMPESVTDRPTSAHEHVFLLTKSPSYFYDHEAMKEPGVCPPGTKGAKGSAARFAEPGVNSRPPEYKIYDGMRNRRNVWTIGSRPFKGAHFATMPVELAAVCVKGGSRERDMVLDPFAGAGTTGVAAIQNGRKFIGVELNPEYVKMANERILQCGATK